MNLKKPVIEGHILYDSIYMKCPEQANPQRQQADRWLPGAGSMEEGGVDTHVYEVSLWGDETFWN